MGCCGSSDTGRRDGVDREPSVAVEGPREASEQEEEDQRPMVVQYGNGFRYEGTMRDGLRNGRGTYHQAATGNDYTGQWLNDDMHGDGTYRYGDGRSYTGPFRFGRFHGRGTYTFPNGSHFNGAFANDLIDGAGVFTTADGARHEVDWRGVEPVRAPALIDEVLRRPMWGQNLRDGRQLPQPSPNPTARASDHHLRGAVEFEFVEYPNGDQYEGGIGGGLRNGRGTYRWAASGNVFTGQWLNDDMHGNGTHRYGDGRSYIGAFRAGRMHGPGTYFFADGSRFVGDFINDFIVGTGLYRSADGVRYDVDWSGAEPRAAPTTMADRMTAQEPAAGVDDGRRWSCPRCTFDNNLEAAQCAMCDTARPPSEPAVRFDVRQESIRSIAEAPAFVRQHTAEEAAEAFGLTRAESLEFTSACVICIAAPRRVALVPCGHFCLCAECLPLQARVDKRCPMCRSNFAAGLRVIVPPLPLGGSAGNTSCSGCGEKPRTHAAIPCGHLVLCGDCADGDAGARACTECDKQAVSWHRIFMLPTNGRDATGP